MGGVPDGIEWLAANRRYWVSHRDPACFFWTDRQERVLFFPIFHCLFVHYCRTASIPANIFPWNIWIFSMAFDDSLMLTLLHIIVVFLLLLVIAFAVPKLQPLLYTSIFFIALLYLLTTIVFPFGRAFVHLFESLPNPFVKLLIGSAILYFVSELIAGHIEEAGYGSLAAMSHFAIKLTILLLWIDQTTELIEVLSSLITKWSDGYSYDPLYWCDTRNRANKLWNNYLVSLHGIDGWLPVSYV